MKNLNENARTLEALHTHTHTHTHEYSYKNYWKGGSLFITSFLNGAKEEVESY